MMELLLRCPRCGEIRRWISYDMSKPEELKKTRVQCFGHKGTFRAKNSILKIVRTTKVHPNRVPYTDMVKILIDEIKCRETSVKNLKTIVMRIGATDVDFARGINQLHDEGIIFRPNRFCVRYNKRGNEDGKRNKTDYDTR